MKAKLGDLAIFGGRPAFTQEHHVGRPNIGNRRRLMARINDILDKRWLTNNGPCVQEFERRIADMLNVRHCIAMCNGTVALEIVVRAVGMTGEVILPAFTFIATAHALQWQRIKPQFCDIDSKTYNIDPLRIEERITPYTTGIIGVHLWGRPCDVIALTEIAKRYKLKLIFDAAHAFGCSYQGRAIGSFGEAEVFSFHATKFFNTFEGGVIVTNDDGLADRIRLMKNFGFAGYDNVIYVGTNGKMNEVSAAMGLTGLEALAYFIEANRRNYKEYQRTLQGLPGIRLLAYDEKEKNNFQYIVLEIDESITGINRNQFVEILHAENVLARKYFYPGCHQMEPYRSLFFREGLSLPITETLASRVLSLPTGTGVSQKDIGAICNILQFVIDNAEEVREWVDRLRSGKKPSVLLPMETGRLYAETII
jgi:dTDP-4-amino-4,6-dideoxygalactose transaminase